MTAVWTPAALASGISTTGSGKGAAAEEDEYTAIAIAAVMPRIGAKTAAIRRFMMRTPLFVDQAAPGPDRADFAR
jgi:hypothetical protein